MSSLHANIPTLHKIGIGILCCGGNRLAFTGKSAAIEFEIAGTLKNTKVGGAFISEINVNYVADNQFGCRNTFLLTFSQHKGLCRNHASNTGHNLGTTLKN